MLTVLTIISAMAVIIIAVVAVYINSKSRGRVRAGLEHDKASYPTASAGTPSGVVAAMAESIPTKYTCFRACDGEILNPNDYLQFVVKGDSMQFCGIKNDDLIFVKKGFKLSDLQDFPVPVVIRRHEVRADETQYKVRRAWGVCGLADCEKLAYEIIDRPEFKEKIAVLKFYDGNEAVMGDLINERLIAFREKFNGSPAILDGQVIVSTTFHTDCQKIRFSIHPVADVVGVVSESFTV